MFRLKKDRVGETLQFVFLRECLMSKTQTNMDMVETWFSYHVTSLITSTASCVALLSFLGSILPTKRNLFTFLDALLILAMTGCVDVMVRIVYYLKCWCNSFLKKLGRPRTAAWSVLLLGNDASSNWATSPSYKLPGSQSLTYKRSPNPKPKMPFERGNFKARWRVWFLWVCLQLCSIFSALEV